ncbi:hypothetical protein H311_02155 [Anncaliia algerae PRA109]|nr:hypothetical protein H311_02155 [Anncaliia algerae PRA109]
MRPYRKGNTPFILINQYFRPGTFIITSRVRILNILEFEGYAYPRNIDPGNFLNRMTGEMTNRVESPWRNGKEMSKERFGISKTLLNSCLGKFICRQKFVNFIL